MNVDLIAALGSLAMGSIVAMIVLSGLLALIPAGRPFLGYAILTYRRDFVGLPERGLRAPPVVRTIFLIGYLICATTALAAYMTRETTVSDSEAAICLRATCLAELWTPPIRT